MKMSNMFTMQFPLVMLVVLVGIIKVVVSQSLTEPLFTRGCRANRGQFPHETFCQQYYNCWDGRATIEECPGKLLFNPIISACDYPEAVNCGARLRNPEPAVTADGRCLKQFGVFPDQLDCTAFYKCSHGRAYRQICPYYTAFDERYLVCVHAYEVDCGGRGGIYGTLAPPNFNIPDGGSSSARIGSASTGSGSAASGWDRRPSQQTPGSASGSASVGSQTSPSQGPGTGTGGHRVGTGGSGSPGASGAGTGTHGTSGPVTGTHGSGSTSSSVGGGTSSASSGSTSGSVGGGAAGRGTSGATGGSRGATGATGTGGRGTGGAGTGGRGGTSGSGTGGRGGTGGSGAGGRGGTGGSGTGGRGGTGGSGAGGRGGTGGSGAGGRGGTGGSGAGSRGTGASGSSGATTGTRGGLGSSSGTHAGITGIVDKDISATGQERQYERPISPEATFRCPHPRGLYPNALDCSRFWLCREYKPSLLKCPTGQLFDLASLSCVNPEKAQCSSISPRT